MCVCYQRPNRGGFGSFVCCVFFWWLSAAGLSDALLVAPRVSGQAELLFLVCRWLGSCYRSWRSCTVPWKTFSVHHRGDASLVVNSWGSAARREILVQRGGVCSVQPPSSSLPRVGSLCSHRCLRKALLAAGRWAARAAGAVHEVWGCWGAEQSRAAPSPLARVQGCLHQRGLGAGRLREERAGALAATAGSEGHVAFRCLVLEARCGFI